MGQTLSNSQVAQWGQFYLRLIAVTAWNSLIHWFYVVTGAAVLQATSTVDFRTIGWKGAGWTILGTLVASIAAALFRHQLPDPQEPTPPAQ